MNEARTSGRSREALSSQSEQTRAALIRASLRLFGQKGFDGTSTRDIAAAANANIGSIAYHFGGKEGLRLACAGFIVDTVQRIAGPAIAAVPLGDGASGEAAAMAQIDAIVERMVGFIVAEPQAGEIVQFVLRELSHPTAALDAIYTGLFEPIHRRLCAIWAAATGEEAEAEETRLRVFAIIGQVIYFRIGREAVLRRMGWRSVGAAEAVRITSVVRENVHAIGTAIRGRSS
ncbi:MAG TPA: CerR family C-terminal domain-containing protein [Rhizobiales bacterium]|nr:CerR family C-terminal domain-containing protein [Hyphomicrobiales bacterium]